MGCRYSNSRKLRGLRRAGALKPRLVSHSLRCVYFGPAGGFLPLVATKLTQSPWFLKSGLPDASVKLFQPSFLHCVSVVGIGFIVTLKLPVAWFPALSV